MNTIVIKNLSTLTDFSAVARVASYIAGDEHSATNDWREGEVVKVTKRGNTYTVTDRGENN